MPSAKTLLYDETSGKVNRFYIPHIIRYKVFESTDELSHPGIRASMQLNCSKYIWPELNKDVAM